MIAEIGKSTVTQVETSNGVEKRTITFYGPKLDDLERRIAALEKLNSTPIIETEQREEPVVQ